MKSKLSFESKVLAAIIVILIAVLSIGFFAFKGMNTMLNTLIFQTAPNEKLLLLKGISTNLDEAENSVKKFTLTSNFNYIDSFKIAKANTHIKLNQLDKIAEPIAYQKLISDSLHNLISERFLVLEQIHMLPHKDPINKKLDKVYKDLVNQSQTTTPEPEAPKKRSLLKKIFTPQNNNQNKKAATVTKSQLEAELNSVKNEEAAYKKSQLNKQFDLNRQDQLIMDQINALIRELESTEAIAMIGKTGGIQQMSRHVNQYIILVISGIALLLIILAYTILRYIKKGRAYNLALQIAKSQTDELYRAKQNFFTRMSHEIRTPITAILGFTDQVLNSSLTKEQNLQLAIVKKSGEHLLLIANEILDLSKLEAGKLKTELTPFDPKEILNEVFVMMQNEATQKKLNYTITGDENLPATFLGDPMRLKQVLLNVLGNAIKFTEKGDVKINYTITKTGDRNVVLNIAITDTGIGIAQSRINKVFNEFEQADEHTSLKFGGTGLGLNISEKLLKLLNGNIELKSEENKGTTVLITIPYEVVEKPKPVYKINPQKDEDNAQLLKGISVLIVDDNEYNQLLFVTILKAVGVISGQALNGKIAIDMLNQNHYDIILMDLIMPEMNGIEATTYIRTKLSGDKAKVPIIALTALGSQDIIQRAQEAGINDMLNKPFKKHELFKKIQALLKVADDKKELITDTLAKSATPLQQAKPGPAAEPLPFNLSDLYKVGGSNKSFITDMIEIFIRTTKEGIDKVKQFAALNDWENLANAAHKISAPCKHIQANELLVLIKKIENDARAVTNTEQFSALVIQFENEANKIIALLENEVSKLK